MYQTVWNKIKDHKSIVIFGHVNPDGDCYGSETGLKQAIKDNFPEKEVYAVGSGYPRLFNLLGELDKVEDEVIKNSLAIVVDTSNQERVEDQRYKLALDVIKIDHHIAQEHFGNPELLETNRISCTELLTKLLKENNALITKEAALGLFLGMVTDSGRFLYQPIAQESYELAGLLASTGIDLQKLYDVLYEVDEKLLRFKGYIYLNYKKTKENVAYLVIPKEDLNEFGIDYNLAASQVNAIANIKDVPAWIFFSESDSGLVRVEFRSKDVIVQQVASKFGRGGHLHASGCRLDALEDYKYVLEALDKACRE